CLVDLDRQSQVDAVLARLDQLAASATSQARALEARARALLVRLHLDSALAAGTASLELAIAAKDAGTIFHARLVTMQILAKLDRLDEAEALLIAARAFAESEASVRQRVYFFEAAAFLATQNERFDEGRVLWQKLEASAAEMKSPRTVATALNY